MQKHILITGGAGFIGSNAAQYFGERGYKVTFLDNLSRIGSSHNMEWLRGLRTPAMSFVHGDIRNTDLLKKLFSEESFDAILHCAAQVAVTSSVEDPLYDHEINVRGTLNLLEALRKGKNPNAVFLFTSTNKVYGEMHDIALIEAKTRHTYAQLPHGVSESLALDFHSPYGCSKGAADQYVRDYARIYGMRTVVFRQSCVYGAHQFGMVDQGWVAYLTMQAFFNKPITIFGDGKQVRDVLYITDLLRAMEAAIETPARSAGKIFNMGGGPNRTSSLLEFVEFLEKRFNKKLEVQFSNWRPGDQKVYISDIRKAESTLSWSPQVSFTEGFEQMFSWIEEHKNILEKFI